MANPHDPKEITRLSNIYRREAIELQIRSSYRQSLYIKARLQGYTIEEAVDRSTGNIREKGYTDK